MLFLLLVFVCLLFAFIFPCSRSKEGGDYWDRMSRLHFLLAQLWSPPDVGGIDTTWVHDEHLCCENSGKAGVGIRENGMKNGKEEEEKNEFFVIRELLFSNPYCLLVGQLLNGNICLPINLRLFLHETWWRNIPDHIFSSNTLHNLLQLLKTFKFLDLQNCSLNVIGSISRKLSEWKYSRMLARILIWTGIVIYTKSNLEKTTRTEYM